MDYLTEFKYVLECSSGNTNIVADTLSSKNVVTLVYMTKGLLLEHIKEGLQHDERTQVLMELADKGKIKRFWLKDGVLYIKGQRIYVLDWRHLKRDILKEYQNSRYAGHPDTYRTLSLVRERYYWPRLRDDVDEYVRTCLM